MSSTRIDWIDRCKAIAIIGVVYGHVGLFSMQHWGVFSIIQDSFCMAFFFSLSGFFVCPIQDNRAVFNAVMKKFLRLGAPFCFFGLTYTVLIKGDIPFWSLFYYESDIFHNGYWFLLVLLEMHVLLLVLQFFCNIFKMDNVKIGGCLLVIVWGLLHFLNQTHFFPETVNTALSLPLLRYYLPFFAIGFFLSNFLNKEDLRSLFSSRCLFTICSIIFLSLLFLRERFELDFLPVVYLLAITGILSVIYLVTVFESNNSFNRCLSYCGRHTLEIYVLHYFFLPTDLVFLKVLIHDNANIALEFILFLFITATVVILSLFLSRILKQNLLIKYIL